MIIESFHRQNQADILYKKHMLCQSFFDFDPLVQFPHIQYKLRKKFIRQLISTISI